MPRFDLRLPECPARVVDLCHRRWTIPLLAEIHEAAATRDPTGARVAGLLHRLGAGRESLRQTLDFATAHGWVVRNPGHGHPLRPEFVLTRSGGPVAEACAAVRMAAGALGEGDAIGRKWSVPVLRVLAEGPGRFGEIKAALAEHGVTDRALSIALRDLHARRLVRREMLQTHPPGVSYSLAPRALALARAVLGL